MKFVVQQLNDNDHGKLETKSVFLLGSQRTVSTQLSCLLSSCLFSSTWRNGLGLQFGLLAPYHHPFPITNKVRYQRVCILDAIGIQICKYLLILLFKWLSTYCVHLAELCVVELFVQLYLQERPWYLYLTLETNKQTIARIEHETLKQKVVALIQQEMLLLEPYDQG